MKKKIFILNLLNKIYFTLKIITFLRFSFAGSNSQTNFSRVEILKHIENSEIVGISKFLKI